MSFARRLYYLCNIIVHHAIPQNFYYLKREFIDLLLESLERRQVAGALLTCTQKDIVQLPLLLPQLQRLWCRRSIFYAQTRLCISCNIEVLAGYCNKQSTHSKIRPTIWSSAKCIPHGKASCYASEEANPPCTRMLIITKYLVTVPSKAF